MNVHLHGSFNHLGLGDRIVHDDVLDIYSIDLVELANVHCFGSTVSLLITKDVNFTKLMTLPKNGKWEVILSK
jgi:hypothetical protein